jgi:hypothetical protein
MQLDYMQIDRCKKKAMLLVSSHWLFSFVYITIVLMADHAPTATVF